MPLLGVGRPRGVGSPGLPLTTHLGSGGPVMLKLPLMTTVGVIIVVSGATLLPVAPCPGIAARAGVKANRMAMIRDHGMARILGVIMGKALEITMEALEITMGGPEIIMVGPEIIMGDLGITIGVLPIKGMPVPNLHKPRSVWITREASTTMAIKGGP